MFVKTVKRIVVAALFCGAVTFCGCNSDRMWESRRIKNAPVADPANPGRVDLTKHELDITVADAGEVDLVENVLTHRALYHRGLEQLREYYQSHGYVTKQSWAEFEIKGLKSVQPFQYLLDAEVSSDRLRPAETLTEADAAYQRGVEMMRRGGHGVPVYYRQDLMVEAAGIFKDMIQQYPSSDKIDDAAFMLGEIHKEYLPGQEPIAVKWYERAYTWDPATPHPARFQAAVVYDYRLHDRDRALELYQAVVKEEVGIESNLRFAMRRIGELTSGSRTAGAAVP